MRRRMEYTYRLGFVEHLAADLRVRLRPGPLAVAHLLFPAAGVYFLYDWWRGGTPFTAPRVALLAAYLLFTPLLALLSVVVARARGDEARVRLSDAGVGATSPAATTDAPWNALVEVRETRGAFLFFVTRRTAILLPKRLLASAGELDDVRALVRSQAGSRAKLLG
jgi:YcxB-like protein